MSDVVCPVNLNRKGVRARALGAVVMLAAAVAFVVWVRATGRPPALRWIALAPFAAGALSAFQAAAGT